MKIDYEGAKKEAFFIVLPLLTLFIIKLMNNDLANFIHISDFSLASSIMYGQLLAKTLDVPDKNKKRNKFSTFQVKIFCFAMVSMVIYISFQLITRVGNWFYWVQFIMFIIGILYYIPASSAINKLKDF